jgi:hypothetical protein
MMRGQWLTASAQISVAALHTCCRSSLHVICSYAHCVSAGNCLLRIKITACGQRSPLEQESCLSGRFAPVAGVFLFREACAKDACVMEIDLRISLIGRLAHGK